MTVFSPAWWEAATSRAAYTALAALAPLVFLFIGGEVTPLYVGGVVAASLLASLVTSLAGIPEVVDKTVPLWRAVVVRVLKTAAQVAAPSIVGVLTVADVDWDVLWQTVLGAALTTLIRVFMAYLPEAPDTFPVDEPVAAGPVISVNLGDSSGVDPGAFPTSGTPPSGTV